MVIILVRGGFIMFSNKKFALIILLLIFVSFTVSAENVEQTGLIIAGNLEERLIKIDSKWYKLSDDAVIYRNDKITNLSGVMPPGPGFNHWTEYQLNNNQEISLINSYYSIVEGSVKDINIKAGLIELEPYKSPDCDFYYEVYHYQNLASEKLTKGDNIILVTAKAKVIKLINQ